MSELNIIAAKPMLLHGAPISYLQDALYYWICQPQPMLNTLCEALESAPVGESTLVPQFETNFWVHRGQSAVPRVI